MLPTRKLWFSFVILCSRQLITYLRAIVLGDKRNAIRSNGCLSDKRPRGTWNFQISVNNVAGVDLCG